MAFNWADQEIQKPEFTSMEEVFKSMQNVREMRRKRAIEDAIKAGVGPDGQPNESAIRQSLAASGFGEDADAVVRGVYNPRLADISSTADVAEKLNRMSEYGIVSPDRARSLFENYTRQQEVPQIDTSWADKPSGSQPTGSPGQSTATQSTGVDGTVRITANPMQDTTPTYETVKTKAEAVPAYGSDLFQIHGPIEGQQFGSGNISAAARLEYILPTSGSDRDNILRYSEIAGYGLPSSATSQEVTEALKERAEAMVPMPVLAYSDPKEPYKARNDYRKALAERPALVAQKFQELKKELETGAQTEFAKGVTRAGEVRAESAEGRAKSKEERDKEKDLALLPASKFKGGNPNLWRGVTQSESDKIEAGKDGLADYNNYVELYEKNPSFATGIGIITSYLKANSIPVTIDNVEVEILKSGMVPRSDELLLKKALRSLDIKDLVASNLGLDKLLSNFGIKARRGNFNSKTMAKNIADQIYIRGGIPYDGYAPSAAAKLAAMKEQTKSQSGGGKSGTESTSKKGRSL